MPAIRAAVLDDYQGMALNYTDWSAVKDRIVMDVFSDTIADEDLLTERLQSYQIICVMRERTKFTPALLDKLPNLK
jgi:phosphoglycerate dehydrogenase-like enzyme